MQGNLETLATIAATVFGTGGVGVACARWFLGHISKLQADNTRLVERALDDAQKGRDQFREALAQQREADRAERAQERADFARELAAHRDALMRVETECSKQREADRKLLAQVLAQFRRRETDREEEAA